LIGGKIPLFRQVTNFSSKLLKYRAVICSDRDRPVGKSVIFVVSAPVAARPGVALSARMALCVEPTHHDPVGRLRPLDIREAGGVGDLLVAAARNETGETSVFARRRIRPVWSPRPYPFLKACRMRGLRIPA
jgi:hypothetical protein